MNYKTISYIFIILFTLLLTSCSQQYGRYQQKHDSHPTRLPTANELRDAVPKLEPQSPGGNRDYTVRGQRYKVMDSAESFVEHGTASWYGEKFHGHLTSNGEIYNMYGMSAAHKHLPLPTYVKVTNLENQKSVIVRVNDRGPFHAGRVIDLSYSAAYKLDMLKTGTADVKVEAIIPTNHRLANSTIKPKPQVDSSSEPLNGLYIQVFATKDKNIAERKASTLSLLYKQPSLTSANNGIYRVKLGPITDETQRTKLLESIQRNGYPTAFKLDI
ncbi:septal ring lytic transglycosylase RlpA family protein [Thalassotalea ganghwensis]